MAGPRLAVRRSGRALAHSDRRRPTPRWRQYAGFAPAAVLFGVFFVVPLIVIVVYSFWDTEDYALVPTFTLENYQAILGTDTYFRTFAKTVLMAALATAATLVLAFPFCYWLVRYVPGRLQRILFVLIVVPFWTSYLLRVYSWVAILGSNGAINSALELVGITDEPVSLFLYDNPAVFIVLVYLYFPFAALTLYASLERFDWRLMHAAVDLGASARRALVTVVLPQMRLALVTSGIFVFIPILGEYLAPQAIGGTNGVLMGNLIANFFAGYLLPLGSAASVLVATVILLFLVLFRKSLDTKDLYA